MADNNYNLWHEFKKGLWQDIPPFRLVLGTCPALAVTNSVINGIAMGFATIFLMADTVIFAHNRTNNVARPIAMPFMTELVAVRAGHVPSTSLNGGISCHSPFLNSCQRL